MLLRKRNTDDGDEEQEPKYNMGDGDPEAAAKNPDDVEYQAQAAAVLRSAYYLLPEGPECKKTKLETLQSERNADDGEAKHQAADKIAHGRKEAAKNKPDKVS